MIEKYKQIFNELTHENAIHDKNKNDRVLVVDGL